MKKFFPDVDYNKGKRKKYFILLGLGILLLGGTAAAFFLIKQATIAILMLVFLVIALTTLPSLFSSYPVKEVPLVEVEGTTVRLYGKEEYKASDILAASALIELPKIKGTKEEKIEYLKDVASKKPTSPITGACDINVTGAKGKQETKYNIVSDCVGCLEALIEAGVKRYRVVYCMDKLSVAATYSVTDKSKPSNKELSEKERLMQLL